MASFAGGSWRVRRFSEGEPDKESALGEPESGGSCAAFLIGVCDTGVRSEVLPLPKESGGGGAGGGGARDPGRPTGDGGADGFGENTLVDHSGFAGCPLRPPAIDSDNSPGLSHGAGAVDGRGCSKLDDRVRCGTAAALLRKKWAIATAPWCLFVCPMGDHE